MIFIRLPAGYLQPKVMNEQITPHNKCGWQPQNHGHGQRYQGRFFLRWITPQLWRKQVEDGDAGPIYPVIDHAENQEDLSDNKRGAAVQGNLVSEDSSLYGIDNYKKKKLLKLLEAIEKIGFNDAYFRLLYYYPDREIYNIVDFISESKSFIKYIDIPFQHVSSKILRSMKRDIIDPRKICNYIKKKGLIVRSSLMTGFPGEMLSDYIDLKHFIKDGYIDKTYNGSIKVNPTSAMEFWNFLFARIQFI